MNKFYIFGLVAVGIAVLLMIGYYAKMFFSTIFPLEPGAKEDFAVILHSCGFIFLVALICIFAQFLKRSDNRINNNKTEDQHNLTDGNSPEEIIYRAGLRFKSVEDKPVSNGNDSIKKEAHHTDTDKDISIEFIIRVRILNHEIFGKIIANNMKNDCKHKGTGSHPDDDCRGSEHQSVEKDIIIKVIHENEKTSVYEREREYCGNEYRLLIIRHKPKEFKSRIDHENKKFSDAQK